MNKRPTVKKSTAAKPKGKGNKKSKGKVTERQRFRLAFKADQRELKREHELRMQRERQDATMDLEHFKRKLVN